MNHRALAWVALLCATLLTGCRMSAPSVLAVSSAGTVHADSEQSARQVRDRLDELAPAVRNLLPGTEDRPIEVWVQQRLEVYRGFPYPPHIAGMADFENSRIHVRDGDDNVSLHLAHELVHITAGKDWKRLPGILEEGVCDLVAVSIVPEAGREQHVKRLVEACALLGGLRAMIELRRPEHPGSIRADVRLVLDDSQEMSLTEVLSLSPQDVFHRATGDGGVGLYGVGYLIARRIVDRSGFEGLHRLCKRAARQGHEQIPPQWVLAAAQLDGSREQLQRAVIEEFGPQEVLALAELMSDELAQTVLDIGRHFYGDVSAEDFLETANPLFSMARMGARASSGITLRRQPRFRAEIEARW